MKKMKKFLAVLMTLAMVMGLSLTSFAATTGDDGADNIVGTVDDRGTITVKGIEETDATVTAYPIVTAKYNTTTNVFEGYENPYNVTLTAPTKDQLDAITAEQLAAIDGEFNLTYDSTTNTYKASNVKVGMYLIVVTGAEVTQYNRAVVSVYYTNESGSQNVIAGSDLDMIAGVVASPAWVKKSLEVSVTKKVNGQDGITSDVGDINNYVISVSPVPNYSGSNAVFKITDVMPEGVTYQNDVKVYVNNAEVSTEKYTATYTEATRTLVVDFVKNGVYTMNEYDAETVEIRYSAKLNTSAQLNGSDNENVVKLDYTLDSTKDDDSLLRADQDDAQVYSFDISNFLLKTGADIDGDGTADPLDGATFKLYTDADCATEYYNDFSNAAHTYVTANGGKFEIKGLAAGTYYLKETAAPDGYSVNTHVYKIIVTAVLGENGEYQSWNVTFDDQDIDLLTIANTKLSALPSTGGIGTTIFTIGGCAIMIAAAYMFFVSRRKDEQ